MKPLLLTIAIRAITAIPSAIAFIVVIDFLCYMKAEYHRVPGAEIGIFEPFEPFFYSMDDPTAAERLHLIRVSRGNH